LRNDASRGGKPENVMRRTFPATLFFLFCLSPLTTGILSGTAWAEGFSGLLEVNYTIESFKTTDASGTTVKTDINTFNPRFTLTVDKRIFPNLRFLGTGFFEKEKSDGETNGRKTETEVTRFRPFLELRLETPLYTAAAGFSRRQEKTETSGFSGVTTVSDEYTGILGWRPEGLPSFDLRMYRINRFDDERSFLDIHENLFNLQTIYSYKGLWLMYYGLYDDSRNNIVDQDTEIWSHHGRATYSGMVWDDRILINGSYDINRQEVTTKTGGQGTVSLQIFPLTGLSSLDDTPADDALNPNPALIDGNLTASAGINLGLPPLGGDTRRRNIGLDLSTPTELNKLEVWVDRDLPPEIANSFSWDVYTSSDNLTWTFWATVSSAPFGPFEYRFEMRFRNVTSRFVKVVTRPLSPTVPGSGGFPDIFVTELQAFIDSPAEGRKEKATRTGQILSIDTRTRLLGRPSLFYDLSVLYNRVDPSGLETYTISNGLFATHRLSKTLSGSARVRLENGEENGRSREAFYYNASLVGDFLRAMRNNLIFSGQYITLEGESSTNNSLVFYNSATLYKGIDAYVSPGISYVKQAAGAQIWEFFVNGGVTLIPHRRLTMTISYSGETSRRTGGGIGKDTTSTQRLDIDASYTPFPTLQLVGFFEIFSESGRNTDFNQNYGVNWQPFPGGALQFSFYYNEELRTDLNEKNRIITPRVRWKIFKKSFLDVSYQWIKSKTDIQTTKSNIFSVSLQMYL
jgi:hypothetical protein